MPEVKRRLSVPSSWITQIAYQTLCLLLAAVGDPAAVGWDRVVACEDEHGYTNGDERHDARSSDGDDRTTRHLLTSRGDPHTSVSQCSSSLIRA